jgi:hypothetical protein
MIRGPEDGRVHNMAMIGAFVGAFCGVAVIGFVAFCIFLAMPR